MAAAIGLGLALFITGDSSHPVQAHERATALEDESELDDLPKAVDRSETVASRGDLDEIRERGVLRVLTRNDSVSYFLYKGKAFGFDYEMAKALADELGVRMQVIVPPGADQLLTWLEEGRGDLVAASLTVTPDREERVAFSWPYLFTDEVVVGGPGVAPIHDLADLRGKRVHLRRSSSYASTLLALEPKIGEMELVWEPETVSTQVLLHRVATGQIGYTVADDHLVQIEQSWSRELSTMLALTSAAPGAVDTIGKPRRQALPVAFAIRKGSPHLKQAVDAFVQSYYRGMEYNVAKKRYFLQPKRMRGALEDSVRDGRASKYDEIFKRAAEEYGLDWRLLAAQCYQESRFDPNAESWVGAIGLLQVMPATGAEMGYSEADLRDPVKGTEAGARYLAGLIERFQGDVEDGEEVLFALASYNGGRGHVLDAIELAGQRGLDSRRWFGNVEESIKLLEDRGFAQTTRYGYCRASEVVGYVRGIMERFDNYRQLLH